ncbi:MAG: aminotransferase class V-fold PLP-dependent enzyme [Methylobacterium sp.]|nr:aminotransferase class V-fold PLP-dependent enzyme [Methylobacterium sp.]
MFDPEAFRSNGHALIDLLADHLKDSLQGGIPVLQWQDPHRADADWMAPLPQQPVLTPAAFLEQLRGRILPGGLAIHHPRNLGHQVATPLPMAALCDLFAALTNQAMAVYETGPAATLIERQVIRWLAALADWQDAAGVLTSGGAQANLTALLAARQQAAGCDAWKAGVAAGRPLRILAGEHAHYSVSRAAGIMGLGTDAVVKVDADRDGRLSMPALIAAHRRQIDDGHLILAVVANAGCTATGSIDPLAEIGRYCRQHRLWFHVDGAHGASALLSQRHRVKLQGIALADSMAWDGHKLLYMPAAVSAVLFRNPQHSYQAFAQEATYLFQGRSDADEAFNVSYRTLECTKRMMGLKLWAAFSLYGVDGLAALVDRAFDNAQLLASKIEAAEDCELLMQPQTNIVCFRHGRHDQGLLRRRVVESGAFHLTQVNIHGTTWLRTTLMNPFSGEAEFDALLTALRGAAR